MEGGAIRSGRVISKLELQKCEVKAQRGACMIASKEYMRLHGCAYMHVSRETAMNIKQTTLAAEVATMMKSEGIGEMDALKRVARERGIGKSEAYRELQREQNRRR